MKPPTNWTGPHATEIDAFGRLHATVPPERWPYGLPEMHEGGCYLQRGGLWCDCAASAADDDAYGEGAWPTKIRGDVP